MDPIIYNFIILIIYLAIIITVLGTMAYGGILAAPYVPLWKRDMIRALELSKIKPGEKLYDLGSGDGRIVIEAARRGASSIGFEVALLPYIYSYVKIILYGLRKMACVKYNNFYKADLSDADVIFTFLSPRAMEKLKEKFERELRPKTRIVSCAFAIPGWKPLKIERVSSKSLRIYYYEK